MDRPREMPACRCGYPLGARLLLALMLCGAGAGTCGLMLRQPAGVWSDSPAPTLLTRSIGEVRSAPSLPLPIPSRDDAGRISLHRADVPLEFVTLSWFLLMGMWLLFAGLPGHGQHFPRIVAISGGAPALLFIARGIMNRAPWRTGDAVACVLCLLVAGIVLAARNRSAQSSVANPGSRAVLVACALIAAFGWMRREQLALGSRIRELRPYREMVADLRDNETFLLRDYYAQPQIAELAPRDETPEITVFVDPALPASLCATRRAKELAEPAFGGAIRLIFRRFQAPGGGVRSMACSAEEAALASAAGVHDKPAMFLNGRRVTAFAADNPIFWRAIAADLAHSSAVACTEP